MDVAEQSLGVARMCEHCWKELPPGEARFECVHCASGFTICSACESKLHGPTAEEGNPAKRPEDDGHWFLKWLAPRSWMPGRGSAAEKAGEADEKKLEFPLTRSCEDC